jgi:hypothetical protein
MIDVIEGIINVNNESSNNCPYQDEELGKRFLDLMQPKIFLNYNDDWAVDKNRTLFSVVTKESTETSGSDFLFSTKESENTPSMSQNNSRYKGDIRENVIKLFEKYNILPVEEIRYEINRQIKLFDPGFDTDEIMNDNDFKVSKIVENIRNKQTDFFKLLNEISEILDNPKYYNDTKKQQLSIRLKQFIKTFNSKLKETIELFKIENKDSEKNELEKKMVYYILYKLITEKIITEMNNKQDGGRKFYRTMKKRIRKKRFTRRK